MKDRGAEGGLSLSIVGGDWGNGRVGNEPDKGDGPMGKGTTDRGEDGNPESSSMWTGTFRKGLTE